MNEDLIYKEKQVYKALEELDYEFYKIGVKPFELNVIGGFAMLVQQIRLKDYTDIDYVGPSLPQELKSLIDEIGLRYGLGTGWINNDVMLSETSIEDMETVVGKLEFTHQFDLRVITVNALDKELLLRMKVIAIDTSYSALSYGGDFSRIKDFPDVKLLMDACGFSYNELVDETFDYIIEPDIYYLIRYYLKTGDCNRFNDLKFCKKVIDTKGKQSLE